MPDASESNVSGVRWRPQALCQKPHARGDGKPDEERQSVDDEIVQPRVPARGKKLQEFHDAGESGSDGGCYPGPARKGKADSQPDQHEGERVLAILPEARHRAVTGRAERRKRHGRDDERGADLQ